MLLSVFFLFTGGASEPATANYYLVECVDEDDMPGFMVLEKRSGRELQYTCEEESISSMEITEVEFGENQDVMHEELLSYLKEKYGEDISEFKVNLLELEGEHTTYEVNYLLDGQYKVLSLLQLQ